ncbi:winged helix-turn-helix transcriptional regulator [Amycolatopsis sp. NPDC005232]|uniref:winged helix-turn-helix transcriptional regulator n=1 Tax=Amycolatopsis sp. NPDC005232 TaxID=3157027 RepID=UPI0033A57EB6
MLRAVDGLSYRLLSQRLKELDAECRISRTVVPGTPVRIGYAPASGAATSSSRCNSWCGGELVPRSKR